jgi:hypothetical protein
MAPTLESTMRFVLPAVLFALAACGGKPPAAKPSNTSALKTQKPATATKASTPPKAVPAAKTAGATTVKPPQLAAELETWSFADVDLDGDGAGESGVIAADDKNLLAWFTGVVDHNGSTIKAWCGRPRKAWASCLTTGLRARWRAARRRRAAAAACRARAPSAPRSGSKAARRSKKAA